MNEHVCAEIQYGTENGPAHSDLCFEKVTPANRRLLHDCLDEFLDKSKFEVGDLFYVGDRSPEETRFQVEYAIRGAMMKIEERKDMIRDGILIPPMDPVTAITDAVCDLFEITE